MHNLSLPHLQLCVLHECDFNGLLFLWKGAQCIQENRVLNLKNIGKPRTFYFLTIMEHCVLSVMSVMLHVCS